MPSVKIPKKSTATDMTPFVDVAFLILSFFIMATKFKPPQPVEITTPKSVSADKLKEQDAVLIEMDKTGRVLFTVNQKNVSDVETRKSVIRNLNTLRNLGLSDREIDGFARNTTVGVPVSKLKGFLALDDKSRVSALEGIPVTDSTNNELEGWIASAKMAFAGKPLNFMIKGDNNAKYPVFKGVIDAMRKNDVFKYQLITDPESVPIGSEMYMTQQAGK